MRQALLIGHNFMRQGWYGAAGFMAYVALLTWLGRRVPVNVVNELAGVAVAFMVAISATLALAGVAMDVKTRTILPVLSKGISRSTYLLGMFYGALMLLLVMCVWAFACWEWQIDRAMTLHAAVHVQIDVLLWALLLGFSLSLLMMCAGLLGVSLVESKKALLFPIVIFLGPVAPTWFGQKALATPHTALLGGMMKPMTPYPRASVWETVVEAAVLLAIALLVFSRRDVTVASE